MPKTLLDLRLEVAHRLQDETYLTWTADEIDSYTRLGYDEYCLRSGVLWERSNSGMDDVANQALYTLPARLYEIERVSYKGERLEPLSRLQGQTWDMRFETNTGQVVSWMVEGDGLRKLRKVRIPAANGIAGDTQLEFTRRGTYLTSSFTPLEIPDAFTKYIRFFDLWKCLEREGDGQDLDAADHYKARFEMGIALALSRKEMVQATRIRNIGNEGTRRLRKPPRPVLPDNFPRK